MSNTFIRLNRNSAKIGSTWMESNISLYFPACTLDTQTKSACESTLRICMTWSVHSMCPQAELLFNDRHLRASFVFFGDARHRTVPLFDNNRHIWMQMNIWSRPVKHLTRLVLEAERIYCAIHHDFTTLSNFQLCNSIDWKMLKKKCDITNHSNGLPFRYFGIFQLPNEASCIEKQIQTCEGIKSRTNAYAPHEFASELNATLVQDGVFVVAVVRKSQRARVKYTPTTVDTINASKLKLIYVVIAAWIHVNTTIITIIFGYLAVAERQQGVWWR